eukprot:2586857-Pyramimonas_sp.AAC.1
MFKDVAKTWSRLGRGPDDVCGTLLPIENGIVILSLIPCLGSSVPALCPRGLPAEIGQGGALLDGGQTFLQGREPLLGVA